MATKKGLSDLVREEVKKQANADPAPTSPSGDQSAAKKATGRRAPRKDSSKSKAAASIPDPVKPQSPGDGEQTQRIQDLKAQIRQLEQKNQGLVKTNAQLSAQISSLESQGLELKEVQQQIKTVLAQQQKLTQDLDAAKQDALKLAQENQRLLEKMQELEAVPSQRLPAEQRQVLPSAPPRSPVTYKPPAKKPFARPIAPSRLPKPRVVQNSDDFEPWCYD
ncbi:hypothetical protein [Lyngbya confervoides]|uniref:Uncharacterized protein n=1 Tax=Lyngbya confervoides BDU141951 TaxID=1574623 RepID=A0ABD4T4V4_9CYAN|nr:hypothetical protein [Lyngbya confervoides]MCM1983443.1 hypothetical protein [Lyngbya confervoides BDU141951]